MSDLRGRPWPDEWLANRRKPKRVVGRRLVDPEPDWRSLALAYREALEEIASGTFGAAAPAYARRRLSRHPWPEDSDGE